MISFDKTGNIQFGTENNIQFTQPAEAAGTWNQFQADYRSSGYLPNGVSGSDLNVQQNEISFVTTTIDNVAAPVTDNEQLFITTGSSNAALAALSLDGSTGNWSVNLGPNTTIPNKTCAPINDVIFIIERDFDTFEHRLVTYDKLTGNEVNATGDISGASEGQGFPYFRIQNDLVYGEDQGNLDYTEFNPFTFAETPLIDSDQFNFTRGIAHTEDFILGGGSNPSGDPVIAKFDHSGNLIDSVVTNLPANIAISPDESLVIGRDSAFNIDTFNIEWSAPTETTLGWIAMDEDFAYIVELEDSGSLLKIDLNDGSFIDNFNGADLRFPAVTSDTVYVTNTFLNGGTTGLFALDKSDLSQIFFQEFPANNGRLCVTESSVAVLSQQNDEIYTVI